MRTYSVIELSTDDLVDEIVNNVANEEEYTTNTVVCDSEMAIKLVQKILAIKDSFDAQVINYDLYDYKYKYYYVGITSDFELFCTPVFAEDGQPLRCDDSDYTYIQENVPQSLVEYFGDKWKVIFGIDKDNKFD